MFQNTNAKDFICEASLSFKGSKFHYCGKYYQFPTKNIELLFNETIYEHDYNILLSTIKCGCCEWNNNGFFLLLLKDEFINKALTKQSLLL